MPPAMAPSGVRIRDASAEDAPAIHALYHDAYSAHADPARPPSMVLKDTLDDVRRSLEDSTLLVAEDASGRIVGTICLRRILNLRRLAVDPSRKGEKLGSALLQAGLERARAEGFGFAELGTLPDHPWLSSFYARQGFEDRGIQTLPDGSRWQLLRRRLD